MGKREALILGALLHDVGKFEFRASRDYIPHERYSEYFVNEYLRQFRALDGIREEIRRFVSYHHAADLASGSLQEADHVVASEREVDRSQETRRPLLSILSRVDIGKGKVPKDVFYYSPVPIQPDDPFPEHFTDTTVETWVPNEEEMIRQHTVAWQMFLEDIRQMPNGNLDTFIHTLLAVMEKHLSRVVSAAYKSIPDISLFDHSKMVAAVADCLEESGDTTEPFLVIQGDISGIQRFIYRLASPDEGGTRHTAKRLRGRSFYISLIADTVATLYLKELGLYQTHLILRGGGLFLILAPNTERNRQRCIELNECINRWLHRELRGELGLVMTWVTVGREEMKDFAGVLHKVGYRLLCTKRHRMQGILDTDLFQPFDFKKTMDVCAVCQRDFEKGSGSGSVCDVCGFHVELGKRLVQAEYLIQVVGDGISCDGLFVDTFKDFGIYWGLPRDREEVEEVLRGLIGQPVKSIVVSRLNDTDFLDTHLVKLAETFHLPVTFGFEFIGNYAPSDESGPLEFHELAAIESQNYPMLGVVRMDVDSLGTIFTTGLGENKTVSRLATLSREMNLYFLGYLNQLAERHQVYITYTGGDDLFVVGSWTKAIDFAREVQKDFTRFACMNPNLTISGGIFFCKEDFPIGRAAERCAEIEEEAKKRFSVKNAVSLFGEVVHWDRLKELLCYAQNLLDLLDEDTPREERLPRSFIHRLVEMEHRAIDRLGNRNMAVFHQNLVQLHYLIARHGVTHQAIARNASSATPNPKITALTRLKVEACLREQIIIPASYVIYKTRQLK